jgi:hypothetical protein
MNFDIFFFIINAKRLFINGNNYIFIKIYLKFISTLLFYFIFFLFYFYFIWN